MGQSFSLSEVTTFIIAITPIVLGIINLCYLLAVGKTADTTHTLVNSHASVTDGKVEALTNELALARGESLANAKVAQSTISFLQGKP